MTIAIPAKAETTIRGALDDAFASPVASATAAIRPDATASAPRTPVNRRSLSNSARTQPPVRRPSKRSSVPDHPGIERTDV
jgi:hypothetical protein